MHPGPPRRRRARPVADASLDALLDRSEDLAKGWLLALLEQAPLDDAPRILATDLTREGPRVCEAVLRAIGSDADERRLGSDGPLASLAARAGELAGAAGPRDTAQAVDALQDVMWAAVRSELRDPDPELVSQLAERLAQVTALVRAAALPDDVPRRGAAPVGSPSAVAPAVGSPPTDTPASAQPAMPPLSAVPPEAPAGVTWAPPTPPTPPTPPRPTTRGPEPHLRAWVAGAAPPPAAPPLWVGALAEEIGRTGTAPLSLLLAELEDADRVLAVEDEPGATFTHFTQALRGAMRRQDMLVSETASRAWVIARDTDRAGAVALADRMCDAVRTARPWRGAPLVASVGVAVLGEDGATSAALIDAAEQARFAAAAHGHW
jgi:hypothetical protein